MDTAETGTAERNTVERRARAHRTVDGALDRILAHDMPGFAALWAPDGTMTFPFAQPGTTERLDGRDAVADYVSGYNDLLLPRAVTEQVRHETTDPDTLVVEFTLAGTVTSTGKEYAMPYVAVITVGDRGITAYRDHWSPAAAQDVLGSPGLAEVPA